MNSFAISGQLVDVHNRRIYPAEINIVNGKIAGINEVSDAPDHYLLPGFIDAHVHIESSMLVPTEFARMAVVHGTVATVSDPHEIANVCGIEGIQYMIDNSRQTPFKFFFGAPSCVPATDFETAGAVINAADISSLMQYPDIWYLAEVMNYPGVLHRDTEVLAKIEAAKKSGKPIDGHAPGLKGEDAKAYAAAGITTDHECFTLEEALDKVKAGMQILIREGSAAKNFEALAQLISSHPGKVMFCSDDKHPDDLVLHHINGLVKRALQKGYDLFDVLNAACAHPVMHYQLPVGLLRQDDPADFIMVDDLSNLTILKTYIDGQLVAAEGKTTLPFVQATGINNFKAQKRTPSDFAIKATGYTGRIRVIEAIEGQLVTNELRHDAKIEDGYLVSDTANDLLKIAVVNRYEPMSPIPIAFIKNFGLKKGAIASTVAHDCHNIVVVGVDEDAMCTAVNILIDKRGGIAVAIDNSSVTCMPLPVAGLMSNADGHEVAAQYAALNQKAKELGTTLKAPFMTLSFMALLVIPSLKLSDKGLFNGSKFTFTPLEI